jgi:hypothetical protein
MPVLFCCVSTRLHRSLNIKWMRVSTLSGYLETDLFSRTQAACRVVASSSRA